VYAEENAKEQVPAGGREQMLLGDPHCEVNKESGVKPSLLFLKGSFV
jgi:hypothetical protein